MTRRILFCTIGQTPQVVTETVWALTRQREPPWVPDEVHVVTTTVGLPRVRDGLQDPAGKLAGLFAGKPPPVTIYVPRRDGGSDVYGPPRPYGDWEGVPARSGPATLDDTGALADVNSQRDAALMGDLILRVIALLAEQDAEIHVSLAGGRKTMSAHALLAMTLVGRPGFEASHVLVSPPDFEDNAAFWHPDQGGKIAPRLSPGADRSKAPKLVDPKKAEVILVPTATPYLRYRVKDAAALGRLSLVELVAQHNDEAEFAAHPQVQIVTARNTLVVGRREVALSARLFAVYRLIATAKKENWTGVGPDGTGGSNAGWLSVPQLCFGAAPDGMPIKDVFLRMLIEAVQTSPRDNDTSDNVSIRSWKATMAIERRSTMQAKAENALRPNLTNLRKALLGKFGGAVGSRLAPASRQGGFCVRLLGFPDDAERAPRFGLELPAEAVEIV